MPYPPFVSPRFFPDVSETPYDPENPMHIGYKPFPSYPRIRLLVNLDVAFLPLVQLISEAFGTAIGQLQAEVLALQELTATQQAAIIDLDGRNNGTDAVANQALIDAAAAYNYAGDQGTRNDAQDLRDNAIEARLDALEA